jgi:hypothetical protein
MALGPRRPLCGDPTPLGSEGRTKRSTTIRCRDANQTPHPYTARRPPPACSGGSTGTASGANPLATDSQTSSGRPTDTTAPAGNGKVDCATVNTAAQQLLMVQFLAQLRTPDTVAPIKAKAIGHLDLDTFLAGMHDLHALDAYSSPLGDPKAAIDFYEEAGRAAQVLFATDPITQAAIDTYNQKVGTVAEFLGHQVAISGAIGAAGC